MDSRASRRFRQKASRSRAPGRHPDMPMTAMAGREESPLTIPLRSINPPQMLRGVGLVLSSQFGSAGRFLSTSPMRYSKVFGPFSLGANCGMAKQLGHRELDSQLLEQLRFEMCEQKRIAAGIEKIDVDGNR